MSLGLTVGSLLPARGWFPIRKVPFRVSEIRKKLGTFFHITLIDDSTPDAKDIIEASFLEVDRLSSLLSRHQEGSPVWRLNRSGSIESPPVELTDLVRRSIEWNRITGGFFDITVEPIVACFDDHFDRHRTPPPEDRILELAARIGSEHIHVEDSRIRFGKEDMGITLDGVAKGYIVDRAMEVLRANGVRSALINAGGDIRAIGGKEDGKPWTIAIQDPFRPDNSIEYFDLRGGAVATSGNYQIYYDRDKVFHHIVNPFTGHSPRANASSTVRSSLTTEADALSTALFIMNHEPGIEFIDRMKGVEGLVITRDGNRFASGNWKTAADFF